MPRDIYSFGYDEWTRQWMKERNASNFLGFLVRRDMRGCWLGGGSYGFHMLAC